MNKDLQLETSQPDSSLSDFVDLFWMLANHSEQGVEIASLPDGKVDLVFICSGDEPLETLLMNIDRQPLEGTFPAKTVVFAVSFKLLALEYVLETSIVDTNRVPLSILSECWGITRDDLASFDLFSKKMATKIASILDKKIVDRRKRLLFDAVYASNGSIPVHELAQKTGWTSREMNRYFRKYIGISLKAFCNIIRFKASLTHIKQGAFFPEQNYTDQNHFIKDVKRYAGLTPKNLHKNEDDRFLLLAHLPTR